jgi:hypothetical protein
LEAFNNYKFIFHEDAAVVKHFGVLTFAVQFIALLISRCLPPCASLPSALN